MGKLHQVAAGTHAAMLINTGRYILVDQVPEQFNDLGIYTRISLHQAVKPGDHYRLYQDGVHNITAARAMASDQIVLELKEVLFIYLVLGHRTKTGIDTVDQFVR